MSVKLRIELEKRIVRAFVKAALDKGYRLAVSLDRGYDHDDGMLLGSRDEEKIMDEAFAGDEAHIFIQPAEGPLVKDHQVVSLGWVYIVLGNDGWDVVSDYTSNKLVEDLLTESNRISDQYQ